MEVLGFSPTSFSLTKHNLLSSSSVKAEMEGTCIAGRSAPAKDYEQIVTLLMPSAGFQLVLTWPTVWVELCLAAWLPNAELSIQI